MVFLKWNKNVNGSYWFEKQSKISRLILTVPHSNAKEERLFSMAWKNKTCFRPNLDPEETLGSLITVKLARENEPIHEITLPQEVLDKAKKATKEYNKSFI